MLERLNLSEAAKDDQSNRDGGQNAQEEQTKSGVSRTVTEENNNGEDSVVLEKSSDLPVLDVDEGCFFLGEKSAADSVFKLTIQTIHAKDIHKVGLTYLTQGYVV